MEFHRLERNQRNLKNESSRHGTIAVCTAFRQGYCNNGDCCNMLHTGDSAPISSRSQAGRNTHDRRSITGKLGASRAPSRGRSEQTAAAHGGPHHFCFYFAKTGTCPRQDQCRYPRKPKCSFFADPSKSCKKGDTCTFAHLANGTKTPPRSPSRTSSQDSRNRTPSNGRAGGSRSPQRGGRQGSRSPEGRRWSQRRSPSHGRGGARRLSQSEGS